MQVIENVNVLDRLDEVPAEVSRLRRSGQDVGYDIETTDTDPLTSKIVAIQLKPKGKRMAIVDVRHFTPDDFRTLGMMLEPLFDGFVELVGQNLKFDFEFALVQMGLAAHRAYDTFLTEQVIRGMGYSSAERRQKHYYRMDSIAERYGFEVEKESRSWFIGLDTRPEWDEPFPVEQIRYMRQDVSVVHKIKAAQQALIEEYGLQEAVELENRALFALVGVETWGVQINREGWLSVVGQVKSRADELETLLHLGKEGEFEGLDVHVLKVRNERYMEKWRPYSEWMKARDSFIATRKAEWEDYQRDSRAGHVVTTPDETFNLNVYKNWSEYKKAMLDWWYERHGKLTKPPQNKAGVNLGSWMQVRDGFNDLFASQCKQGNKALCGVAVTSTSEDDLTPYRDRHPLVGIYIEYTHARKVLTVYGTERGKKEKSFIEMLDAHDRLRASYQQIGADTGRMSSYNPNFQQIPADGVGAQLRENVVAAEGYTLVVADFSNIELRIVAELSGDQFLLDAFASGQDVHAYTAKVMFGLSDEQATKKWTDSHNAVVGGREIENTSYRKVAKTINYMLLYGAGVKRLAAMLSIADADAKVLLQLYYETFATAIAWLNKQKDRLQAARNRKDDRVFAETRSGRKRWFDIPPFPRHPANGGRVSVEAIEKWEADKEEWRATLAGIKRQLANTPIQGLSADITKEAAALWYERVGYDEEMRLVAIIHDEYILEVVPAKAAEAARRLAQVMMSAMKKYLHVVDLGAVKPVITPYWVH